MGNNQVQETLVDFISKLKQDGTSEEIIKREYNSFLENMARKSKTPLHGTFELTPLCNLDCKMCYVHLSSSQFSSDNLLPVDTWKKLMSDAHSAGMLYASLTGGECLTYPGFEELYIFLYEMGIVPCVMSNGLLMDEERIRFFQKFPPYHIQITLYGSSDDAYEKVTGRRVFHTIYHNIERLRDSNMPVAVVLTPNSFMRDDIRSLQEAARSLKLPYNINASLIHPRENTGRQLADLSIDQYIQIYRIMKELRHESFAPIDPMEIPEENHHGEKQFGLQCGGGSSGFNIRYDGRMSPCPSFYSISTEPLKEGFIPAWRQLNSMVGSYPIPAECNGCTYYDYCIHCPVIHNNARNSGHCDPRICERTKRLVQEGFFRWPDKEKDRNHV